ncbi:FecR family protein [soil metagenome]
MAGPKMRVETAETEAAAWHQRLGERSVSTQTLEDFFAWRRVPENADAYRRVEQVWNDAKALTPQAGIRNAVEEALSRKVRRAPSPGLRGPLIGAAAVAMAAILAFGSWTWLQSRGVYQTAMGEERVVQLADGSSVRLDTASRIRVRFSHGARRLELESGQALFTVAHDAARPFIVEAGAATVTAVGTVFEVRREDGGATVTLVSGVVDVGQRSVARGERRMTAGHQTRVTAAGAFTAPVNGEAETSWTEGRIVFRDTPLRLAVAEVNRYLTDKVVLDARALDGVRVNGVFKTGDRDAFVSVASEVFDLQASQGPDGSVHLSERGK